MNIFISEKILNEQRDKLNEILPSEGQNRYIYDVYSTVKVSMADTTSLGKRSADIGNTSGLTIEISSCYINSLINHPENVLLAPYDSIFILEDSEKVIKVCEDIKKCGVFAVSEKYASDELKKLTDNGLFFSFPHKKKDPDNWAIFNPVITSVPSNFLLIQDGYFFSQNDENIEKEDLWWVKNLKSILASFLPKDNREKTPFHILLITRTDHLKKINNGNEKESTEKKDFDILFNSIANEILKKLEIKYPIYFEFLTVKNYKDKDKRYYPESDIHNRYIISNYYILQAEKELCAFDKPIIQQQTMTCRYIYSGYNENSSYKSDMPIDLQECMQKRYIEWDINNKDGYNYNYNSYNYNPTDREKITNNSVKTEVTGVKNSEAKLINRFVRKKDYDKDLADNFVRLQSLIDEIENKKNTCIDELDKAISDAKDALDYDNTENKQITTAIEKLQSLIDEIENKKNTCIDELDKTVAELSNAKFNYKQQMNSNHSNKRKTLADKKKK